MDEIIENADDIIDHKIMDNCIDQINKYKEFKEINKMNKKLLIKACIEDSVKNLLYYDRKEDEELHIGDIEKAIKKEHITIEEMVNIFKSSLEEGLKE